ACDSNRPGFIIIVRVEIKPHFPQIEYCRPVCLASSFSSTFAITTLRAFRPSAFLRNSLSCSWTHYVSLARSSRLVVQHADSIFISPPATGGDDTKHVAHSDSF